MQHQKQALAWLLEQHVKGNGSILADEMGLGKTITTISLIYTLHLTAKRDNKQVGPCLIVCPATVINQWKEELSVWSLPTCYAPNSYTFSNSNEKEKRKIVQKVVREDAILIVSYECLRID